LSWSLRYKLGKKHVEKIIKKYGYKIYPVQKKVEVLLCHNPRVNTTSVYIDGNSDIHERN
jgi:hypothetical protein